MPSCSSLRRQLLLLSVFVAVASIIACSEKSATRVATEAAMTAPSADAAKPEGGGGTGGGGAGELSAQPKPDPARVIIYTADMTVYVDSFAEAEKTLPSVLEKFGAHISESEVNRYDGLRRRGRWVIRVPVEQYASLLNAISGIGSVDAVTSKAEEVTAEFVDLEARLKNKRGVEERLVGILAAQAGRISDVLEVEREIARVREEIERVEGRMRFLKNQATLSTVTLNLYERRGYEALPEEPSLADRIKWAWRESTHGVVEFVKSAIVMIVRLTPWSPVIALGIALLIMLKRWRRKRKAAKAAARSAVIPSPT